MLNVVLMGVLIFVGKFGNVVRLFFVSVVVVVNWLLVSWILLLELLVK